MKEEIYRPKNMDIEDIKRACEMSAQGDHPLEIPICIINEEFRQGLYFISRYRRSVTIFGSARSAPESEDYKMAYDLSKKIVEETGYTIVTGGGHGVMGAASHGAHDGGGISVGINIRLPHEQATNQWVTDSITFENFFSRKVVLAYGSEAYITLPGGFGTLDEIFGILTLRQTDKLCKVPIILFGSKYWNHFIPAIRMLAEENYISQEDIDMFTVTDDIDMVVNMIKNAPVRK